MPENCTLIIPFLRVVLLFPIFSEVVSDCTFSSPRSGWAHAEPISVCKPFELNLFLYSAMPCWVACCHEKVPVLQSRASSGSGPWNVIERHAVSSIKPLSWSSLEEKWEIHFRRVCTKERKWRKIFGVLCVDTSECNGKRENVTSSRLDFGSLCDWLPMWPCHWKQALVVGKSYRRYFLNYFISGPILKWNLVSFQTSW